MSADDYRQGAMAALKAMAIYLEGRSAAVRGPSRERDLERVFAERQAFSEGAKECRRRLQELETSA